MHNQKTETVLIAGIRVKVATSDAVKQSSEKIIKQYSQALSNLKNR